MLYKLALRNIARSKIYYGFYLFILVVFAMLLYSVISVAWSISTAFENFNLSLGSTSVSSIFNAMQIFVIILCIFFVLYISRFFVKRRADELALYKLLGLNNRKILALIGIENLMVVSAAAVLGILFGTFFGRIFQQLCLSIMKINIGEMGINFSSGAISSVLLMLLAVWLVAYITPYLYVRNISISKLFVKKSQSSKILKRPIISIILFFASTIYLVLALTIFGKMIIDMLGQGTYILSILITSILCAFTLYKGFLYTLISILRKFNVQYKSSSLLLSLKHIETDTQQLYKLLAVVTIVVGVMTPFGLLVKSAGAINDQMLSQSAYNQFGYTTNDKVVDEALLNAFSEDRNFKKYSYEYQKVVTPDGTFYMLNPENALKMLSMSNPKNGLNYYINDDTDYAALEAQVKALSGENLINVESQNTVNGPHIVESTKLNHFVQSSILFETVNLPTTLLQSSDVDYNERIAQNAQQLAEYKQENPEVIKALSKINFISFYSFVPLNTQANISAPLIVVPDDVYNEIINQYDANAITLRTITTDKAILSSDFIKDFTHAENVYKQSEQPLATNVFNADFVSGLPMMINSGAISILAILIYALLFFVLISTTLFRSLENGEKGNQEYKIATLMGVQKKSILKGIILEAFTIMIFPFLLGFIVSTAIFIGMLKQFLSDDTYSVAKLELSSIFGVMLPILIVIVIMFIIATTSIYRNVYKK